MKKSKDKRITSIPEKAIQTLEIHDFIYHIMIQGTSLPEYLDDVTLSSSQKMFFRDKIKECARGTQYIFEDRDDSDTPILCKDILLKPDTHFVKNSRKLAEQFLRIHPNTASSGILIVSRISMEINGNTVTFVSILKVDYIKVLQQIRDKTNSKKVTFNEIFDSLSEDKSSIQKRALIDTSDTFEWDALAVEKGKSGQLLDTQLAITDYFRRFLSTKLKQNDSVYSRCIPGHVAKWARTQQEVDSGDARAKAVGYMRVKDNQKVLMNDIRDVVCAHTNENISKQLTVSFDSFMEQESVQLKGIEFVVRASSITKKSETTKIETNHNVTIIFEGTKEDSKIEVETLESGQKLIKITADACTYTY
jgi:hypothetical protein